MTRTMNRTVVRRPRAQTDAAKPAPGPAAEVERPALTRETWTDAATEVLVDQGIDHVRVDVLARGLGVTRGSFYWHFRDREELLRSVLQAWRELSTEQLTARLASAHDDPRQQLRDVLSLPLRGRSAVRAARIELAIRAWARRDELARHAVDEADASRISYIAQVFSALGFAVAEARARAFLVYAFVVGESLMPGQGNTTQRQDRGRLVEQLLQQTLLR
ncbi:MAG: TetR/AcrR family transcriptional regulator [Rubrivivax sp.]|nr:TetR/AcrR family transcriptional regulator [Rubrivivax sp.]MDP3612197.1 TetR/AcrR family transcriptional regulator [Rubrivivax sp.]